MTATISTGLPCCIGGIQGEGNLTDGVMIVGHMPGADEMRTRKPFTGPNGSLMDALLEYTGWSRERVYCTNILCQYFKPALPGRTKTGKAKKLPSTLPDHPECVARFEREVQALKPKLIITLGAEACEYMTGMKVSRARGVPVFDTKRKCYVMPTMQPIGAVQGDVSILYHVIRDFSKIQHILRWPQDGSIKDVHYEVIDDPTAARAYLSSLPRNTYVSLDIETDNRFVNIIDIFSDKLLCVGVGYIDPTTQSEVVWVLTPTALQGLCADDWPQDVWWTYQNGPFDKNGLRHYLNTNLPIVHDTMMMSYALDERGGRDEATDSFAGIHGLGPQADEWCGAEFYKEREKGERGTHPAQLDPSVLHRYNAHDVAYTVRLPIIYVPKLIDEDVYDLYENRLMPLSRAFADINYEGQPVDTRYLQDLILKWGPRYQQGEEHLQELAQEYGFPGTINLNSPKQKSQFIYTLLGLEHEQAPSTARTVIEDLDHPWIDAYLDHARLEHIINHYLVPAVRQIKIDGRMHTSTLIHGTTSGRLAYIDPPLQTLPQAYTVGEFAELRRIFIPDSPEHVIAEFDYNQIEMWMAMGLSHDDNMRHALEAGDIHGATTRNVLHVDPLTTTTEEWKIARQLGKKVNFSVIYWISAKELSNPKKGIGGTVRQAQEHINNFFDEYHDYYDYTLQCVEEAKREGYLRTPYGRKRRFHLMLDSRQDRQAVNYKGQSIANDYTLSALLHLHNDPYFRTVLGGRILWGVHDSLVTNLRRDRLEESIDYVCSVMESQHIVDLPTVKVEPKVGPNLYDVKEWKR